jgi:Cytochrome c554 and c-prime
MLIQALLAATIFAPLQENDYIGAQACGACHPTQLGQQSLSGHAASLRPAISHPLSKSFVPPGRLKRAPNFQFTFALGANQFKVKVSDGKSDAEMPIDWAFGSGSHAVTFVSQVDEDSYVEHYFTYYAAARTLNATPGHQSLKAGSLGAAFGLLYRTFDPDPAILRCFRCHSTGRLALGEKLEVRPGELGVRCEACHGPGSLHAAAAGRNKAEGARRTIRNPGRLAGRELNQLCGTCHRKPAPPGAATNWNDPWNTRHQPLYLEQSACFRKSPDALSCLTCHEPHRALRKNESSYYNERCATCHKSVAHPAINTAAALTDCIRCHMPRVEPRKHLEFTNHWIGVYREGFSLKPIR